MAAALRVLRCVSSYLPIGAPARAERGSDNPGTTQIVGPGASAGGLEALEQFLANVRPGSGLAYAVVQHLDPQPRPAA